MDHGVEPASRLCFLHCGQLIGRQPRFDDIAGHAGSPLRLERAPSLFREQSEIRRLVQPFSRRRLFAFSRHIRHRNVEHDNVGPQHLRTFEGAFPFRTLPGDRAVGVSVSPARASIASWWSTEARAARMPSPPNTVESSISPSTRSRQRARDRDLKRPTTASSRSGRLDGQALSRHPDIEPHTVVDDARAARHTAPQVPDTSCSRCA